MNFATVPVYNSAGIIQNMVKQWSAVSFHSTLSVGATSDLTKSFFRILITALAAGISFQAHAGDDLVKYLTARHAELNGKYDIAAEFLDQLVSERSEDSQLQLKLLYTHLLAGNMDSTLQLNRRIQENGVNEGLSNTIHLIDLIRENEFDDAISLVNDRDRGFMLETQIAMGWLHLGNNDPDRAFDAFEEVNPKSGFWPFAEFHKALAQAVLGNFEAADDILNELDESGSLSPESVWHAHAQILNQLGDRQGALEILDQNAGSVSELGQEVFDDLRNRIEANESVVFDFVRSPSHGISEALKNFSRLFFEPGKGLVFGRLSELIEPDHTVLQVRLGRALDSQGSHSLAQSMYGRVPEGDVMYPSAMIDLASSYYRMGKPDRAVATLKELTESHGDSARIWFELGNYQRFGEDYAGALDSYNTSVWLEGGAGALNWTVFFYLGIVKERLDIWEQAKADLNKAIELSDGLPVVLNYLGYSMVERRDSLDVAEDLIRKAVAKDEDNAFYIDSLGWVLYHTGEYEDAVQYMEKATRLMPNDPVVADHLGDTYWMVDRQAKARVQWKRALDLEPDEELEQRIFRKLDVGLDKVLEEEGHFDLVNGN